MSNWRTWLPPEIFSIPRLGTLNVHAALLPGYAGFAPLNWALINDEPEVGVTAHMMNAEFDAGDIVLQRCTPVTDDDTIADLFDRTLEMFVPITVDALQLVASGRTDWTPQDRRAASYFHRRCDEDNRIDWMWPARDIFNLVRATRPVPQRLLLPRHRAAADPENVGDRGRDRGDTGPDRHPPGDRRPPLRLASTATTAMHARGHPLVGGAHGAHGYLYRVKPSME